MTDPTDPKPKRQSPPAYPMRPTAVLIRNARARVGLSQIDLAHAVGTRQPMISAWETGRSVPDQVTRGKLAGCLDVDLKALDDAARDSALAGREVLPGWAVARG